MRRLFVFALISAVLISACGSSRAWPTAQAHASVVTAPSTAATATPQDTASAAPSVAPSVARPTVKPTAHTTAAPTGALAGWQTVAPAGEGFSVLMPEKPTKTTETYSTAVGDAPASMWTSEPSSNLAYFVIHATYPAGSMKNVTATAIFAGAMGGMETSTGGKVTKQGPTSLNNYPGWTFTIETSTAAAQGVLYLVGDEIYMVYVAYTPALTDFSSIDGFLASFNFVG